MAAHQASTVTTAPQLLDPEQPAEQIIRVHRGPDGYICFARRDENLWTNFPAIRVDYLAEMFPTFAQQLMRDSYLSINSFLTPKREYARHLNACWVDIDLHAPGEYGRTVGQRYGAMLDMVHRRELPRPSLAVHSGRGIWFLWLLIGKDGLPPKAYPEKKLAQQELNRELARRMGADQGATDSARMIRVPGSTNSLAEPGDEEVEWRFLADLNGRYRGEEYTMERLAAALGVNLPSLRKPRSPASERGLVGWKSLYAQRHALFQDLLAMRGRFAEGCRNRAAYHYGVILRGYGMDESAVERELTRFGLECCNPPLSQQAIRGALNESKKNRGQVSNETIGAHLLVTSKEARLIPEWVPRNTPRLLAEAVSTTGLNRSQLKQLRRETIVQIVAVLDGRPPSHRQMAKLLAEGGIHVSHVQVMQDYQALHLVSRLPLLDARPEATAASA